MEDQTSKLQGRLQEEPFEVVMRGYNKRQVDDYVLQCQHHIGDLAQRLALAEKHVERVRAEAADAVEKAAHRPVHEEISDRMQQILRLASEEAEREREKAASEITELRRLTMTETQGLREMAQRESTALRERAEQDAAQIRQDADAEAQELLERAHEDADARITEASREAESIRENARTEADGLVLSAQEHSRALLEDAETRAGAMDEVLGDRVSQLTRTHLDVVGRLAELRDVLVEAMGREESLGAFEEPERPAAEEARRAALAAAEAARVAAAEEGARASAEAGPELLVHQDGAAPGYPAVGTYPPAAAAGEPEEIVLTSEEEVAVPGWPVAGAGSTVEQPAVAQQVLEQPAAGQATVDQPVVGPVGVEPPAAEHPAVAGQVEVPGYRQHDDRTTRLQRAVTPTAVQLPVTADGADGGSQEPLRRLDLTRPPQLPGR